MGTVFSELTSNKVSNRTERVLTEEEPYFSDLPRGTKRASCSSKFALDVICQDGTKEEATALTSIDELADI
jgi:hypothetical protein